MNESEALHQVIVSSIEKSVEMEIDPIAPAELAARAFKAAIHAGASFQAGKTLATKPELPLKDIDGAVVRIETDLSPFLYATKSLQHLLERSPQLIEGFLSLYDTGSELCCINLSDRTAGGTRQCRVVFQPSKHFADFIATGMAGNIN